MVFFRFCIHFFNIFDTSTFLFFHIQNFGRKYLFSLLQKACFICYNSPVNKEKKEKRERKILTENRLATVNKRETSFEGLVSQFENGEDGVYNIADDNKHVIFQPKVSITKKDLEDIPELEQTTSSIKF